MEIKGTKWKDDERIEDEMSDTEFQKKVDEEGKTRDLKTYGRDGKFVVWEKTFQHRKLHFNILVLRYYVIGNLINDPHKDIPELKHKIGTKRNKWVVLEYPDSMKPIVEFVSGNETALEKYEFLYADTIHSWNDGMSLRQRFEIMYKQGKADINWWLDDAEKTVKKHSEKIKKEFMRLRKK